VRDSTLVGVPWQALICSPPNDRCRDLDLDFSRKLAFHNYIDAINCLCRAGMAWQARNYVVAGNIGDLAQTEYPR
jgi:hypothetical protein